MLAGGSWGAAGYSERLRQAGFWPGMVWAPPSHRVPRRAEPPPNQPILTHPSCPQAAVVQAPPAAVRHQVRRDVCGAVRRPRPLRVGCAAGVLHRGWDPCTAGSRACAAAAPCGYAVLLRCSCTSALPALSRPWRVRTAEHCAGRQAGPSPCTLNPSRASAPPPPLPPAGAHNTIVTARAGKDLISCLVRWARVLYGRPGWGGTAGKLAPCKPAAWRLQLGAP